MIIDDDNSFEKCKSQNEKEQVVVKQPKIKPSPFFHVWFISAWDTTLLGLRKISESWIICSLPSFPILSFPLSSEYNINYHSRVQFTTLLSLCHSFLALLIILWAGHQTQIPNLIYQGAGWFWPLFCDPLSFLSSSWCKKAGTDIFKNYSLSCVNPPPLQ